MHIGMPIILSNASLHGGILSYLDVKATFFRTFPGNRGVFFIAPRDSDDRDNFLRQLFLESYGLTNANEKGKVKSDDLLLRIRFVRVIMLPNLFVFRLNDL